MVQGKPDPVDTLGMSELGNLKLKASFANFKGGPFLVLFSDHKIHSSNCLSKGGIEVTCHIAEMEKGPHPADSRQMDI